MLPAPVKQGPEDPEKKEAIEKKLEPIPPRKRTRRLAAAEKNEILWWKLLSEAYAVDASVTVLKKSSLGNFMKVMRGIDHLLQLSLFEILVRLVQFLG